MVLLNQHNPLLDVHWCKTLSIDIKRLLKDSPKPLNNFFSTIYSIFIGEILLYETPFSEIMRVVSLLVMVLVSLTTPLTPVCLTHSLSRLKWQLFTEDQPIRDICRERSSSNPKFSCPPWSIEEPQCRCFLKTFKTDQDLKIKRKICIDIAVGSESWRLKVFSQRTVYLVGGHFVLTYRKSAT